MNLDQFKPATITEDNLWHLRRMLRIIPELKDAVVTPDGYVNLTEKKKATFWCKEQETVKNTYSAVNIIKNGLIQEIAKQKAKEYDDKERTYDIILNAMNKECLDAINEGDINKAIESLYHTFVNPNPVKLYFVHEGKQYMLEEICDGNNHENRIDTYVPFKETRYR